MNFINTHLAGLKKGKIKTIKITTGSTSAKLLWLISIIPKKKSRNLSKMLNMLCHTLLLMRNITLALGTTFKKLSLFSSATNCLKDTKVNMNQLKDNPHIPNLMQHRKSIFTKIEIDSSRVYDLWLL